MSLASNTYEAERLDALSLSLRHAQVAIGQDDRWKAIEALRRARQQINETLARLEGQP